MKRITSVQTTPEHHLKLHFNDGVEGVVDVSKDVGNGVFAAWRDVKHFASVEIVRNGRALEWPGEIDLCADALYLEISGMTTKQLFPNWA